MLVDVVVVLEVTVPVVDVIDMVVVRHLLAVVVLSVLPLVIDVNLRLRMSLPVVDVVDVITVHDRLMAVSG